MAERGVLEFADAGFTYREAESSALEGIDLRVSSGQMVAVLGPQASGTTTLCRLAAGLLGERGDASGTILRPDAQCAMLGDDPEAQLTGMTSTVVDEIQLPLRLQGADPLLAEQASATITAELGMGRLRDRRLDTLSGGERQLVALAALMTLSPALLVLDQPTLSLDSAARRHLIRALRRYCDAGGAVLLAAHQHDELSAASDRVVFMRRGRIADRCSPDRLTEEELARHGVWSTLPTSKPGVRLRDSHSPVRSRELPPGARAPRVEGLCVEGLCVEGLCVERLCVKGLCVERAGMRVLQDLRLALSAGEVLTVLGANGSGKSTMLRALTGLLGNEARVRGSITAERRGDDGKIRSDGGTSSKNGGGSDDDGRIDGDDRIDGGGRIEIDGLPPHLRAAHLGWVGQDPSTQLSAATVRGELERALPLPPHRRRDRARVRNERSDEVTAVLDRVGLLGEANTHPYDLGPAERKDLVIGSALLLRAPVLLLDEPTLGRDAAGMRRLGLLIRGYADAGGAVLATTHDLRWAEEISDRSVVLAGGTLAELPR